MKSRPAVIVLAAGTGSRFGASGHKLMQHLGAFSVLTLGLGLLLAAPAALVLLLVIGVVAVVWLVCSLIGAVKAWNGEAYRYPLTIRLLS